MEEYVHSDREREAELRQLKSTITESLLIFGDVEPLLEMIVNFCLDLRKKYIRVDICQLISDNCSGPEDAERLIFALTILSKYALNLIKPVQLRPTGWTTVSFQNPFFRDKVNSIHGTYKILHDLGYTQQGVDCLEFPASQQPERNKVAEISVELLSGKAEIEAFYHGCHPNPGLIKIYFSSAHRRVGNIPVMVPEHLDDENSDTDVKRPMLVPLNAIPRSATQTKSSPAISVIPEQKKSQLTPAFLTQSKSAIAVVRPPNFERSTLQGRQDPTGMTAIPSSETFSKTGNHVAPQMFRIGTSEPPEAAQAMIPLGILESSLSESLNSRPSLDVEHNVQITKSESTSSTSGRPANQTEAKPFVGIIPLAVLNETLSMASSESASSEAAVDDVEKCDICGTEFGEWVCRECDNKFLCTECDGRWHQYPKRRSHTREPCSKSRAIPSKTNDTVNVRPNQGVKPVMNMPSSNTIFNKSSGSVPGPPTSLNCSSGGETNYIEDGEDTRSGYGSNDIESIMLMAKHPPPVYVPPTLDQTFDSFGKWQNPVAGNFQSPRVENFQSRNTAHFQGPVAGNFQSPRVENFRSQNTALFRGPMAGNFQSPRVENYQSQNTAHFQGPVAGNFQSAKTDYFQSPRVDNFQSPSTVHFPGPVVGNFPGAKAGYDETSLEYRSRYPNTISNSGTRDKNTEKVMQSNAAPSGGLKNAPQDFFIVWEWSCNYCTFLNTCANALRNGPWICEICKQVTTNPIFNKRQETLKQETSMHASGERTMNLTSVPNQLKSPPIRFENASSFGSVSSGDLSQGGYKSRFVEMQDEIYREKKEAHERFRLEEESKIKRQSLAEIPSKNQNSLNLLSTSSYEPKKTSSEKKLPSSFTREQYKRATSSGMSTSSSGLMTTSRMVSSPGVMTSSEKKTSGYIPSDQSSSFEKPEYRSRFVEIQDEIYFEKKKAQAEAELLDKSVSAESIRSLASIPQSGSAETSTHSLPSIPSTGSMESTPAIPQTVSAEISSARPKIQQTFVPSAKEDLDMLRKRHDCRSKRSDVDESQVDLFKPSSGVSRNLIEEELLASGSKEPSFANRMEELRLEKQAELMQSEGRAVVRLFKMLESGSSFQDARADCILSLCGGSDPQQFFKNQWLRLVELVINQVRQHLAPNAFTCDGLVETCLVECRGDVRNAVKCFELKWNQMVESLCKGCVLPAGSVDYVTAVLSKCSGDQTAAENIIIREKFMTRVWSEEAAPAAGGGAAGDDDIYQLSTKHLDRDLTGKLLNGETPRDRRIRMIFAEGNLVGWQRAENVISILTGPTVDSEFTLLDVVDAVKNSSSLAECRRFLMQECEICYVSYPSRMIRSLGCCQCKLCNNCVKGHFEVVIRERFVRNLVCPVCSQPDIDTSEQTELHFQFLLLMLRDIVDRDVYELFQTKLRDWNLMMDPLFRWCAWGTCKSGFLVAPDQVANKVSCPYCNQAMCKECKKCWEDQHEGLSCEEFVAWKEANDPEVQALGLARHLEENGIECPQCKCRYSLAKGGCMHFTCIQCRHEFCSGCLQPFKRGKKCTLMKSCAKAGLHCHHPRDCLFYLRDQDVPVLQKLLHDHEIAYDTEPPSNLTQEIGSNGERCRVMEQKQTQTSFKDEPCGKPVPLNFAGLCDIHYKEYLVGLINRNHIDPVNILDENDLIILLKRVELPYPKKKKDESTEHYRFVLIEQVQTKLPLPVRSPPRRQPSVQSMSGHGLYQTDADGGYFVPTDSFDDEQMRENQLQPRSAHQRAFDQWNERGHPITNDRVIMNTNEPIITTFTNGHRIVTTGHRITNNAFVHDRQTPTNVFNSSLSNPSG